MKRLFDLSKCFVCLFVCLLFYFTESVFMFRFSQKICFHLKEQKLCILIVEKTSPWKKDCFLWKLKRCKLNWKVLISSLFVHLLLRFIILKTMKDVIYSMFWFSLEILVFNWSIVFDSKKNGWKVIVSFLLFFIKHWNTRRRPNSTVI